MGTGSSGSNVQFFTVVLYQLMNFAMNSVKERGKVMSHKKRK